MRFAVTCITAEMCAATLYDKNCLIVHYFYIANGALINHLVSEFNIERNEMLPIKHHALYVKSYKCFALFYIGIQLELFCYGTASVPVFKKYVIQVYDRIAIFKGFFFNTANLVYLMMVCGAINHRLSSVIVVHYRHSNRLVLPFAATE